MLADYSDLPLPSGWSDRTVRDVADVVGGSTPDTTEPSYWNGEIPWATPTDITALTTRHIDDTASKITRAGLDNSGAKLLPPDSILVTSRATIGACGINTVPMATNQGFASLVCKNGTDPDFLY